MVMCAMILVCAASDGNNLKLAVSLSDIAEKNNIEVDIVDLVACDLPMFTPARKKLGVPEALKELEESFRKARGFILCAPEYNGSTPPVLSNALAWLTTSFDDYRELFNEKPVGLATHSGGGGAKVMFAMRLQMAHLGCNVVGRELLTNYQKALNPESALRVLKQIDSASH